MSKKNKRSFCNCRCHYKSTDNSSIYGKGKISFNSFTYAITLDNYSEKFVENRNLFISTIVDCCFEDFNLVGLKFKKTGFPIYDLFCNFNNEFCVYVCSVHDLSRPDIVVKLSNKALTKKTFCDVFVKSQV